VGGFARVLVPAGGPHRVAGACAVHQDALLAVCRADLCEGRIDLLVGGDIDLAEHPADFLGDGFTD